MEIIDSLIEQININLDKQEEIRKELNSMRNGKLVIKKRNNNYYYYLEYREGNKVKTDYIGKYNTGEIQKYLDEKDKYMNLKSDLGNLEVEEKKLKKALKSFGVNSYRKVYTLYEIKKILKPVFKKYGIDKAYIFGSYARGEANANSDIDLILRKPTKGSQYDFEDEVKKKTGKEADFIYKGDYLQEQFVNKIDEERIVIW